MGLIQTIREGIMILCSCAVLREREVRAAIAAMLARDPYVVVTPGRVYHALGRRMRCFACLPLIAQTIQRELSDQRAALGISPINDEGATP
ncbi:MAG: hypothetical protein AAFS07_09720 [Pseudomonadota bacterium]